MHNLGKEKDESDLLIEEWNREMGRVEEDDDDIQTGDTINNEKLEKKARELNEIYVRI